MDNLVYEDDTYWGRWQGSVVARYPIVVQISVILILLIVLILTSKQLDRSEQTEMWLYLILASALLGFAIGWARWPRKYQIFDSKVRILLGRPFHFDIPFSNLEYASEGDWMDIWLAIRLNFITSRNNNIVTIVRKKRMGINITPDNSEMFVENLRKALNEWRRNNPTT